MNTTRRTVFITTICLLLCCTAAIFCNVLSARSDRTEALSLELFSFDTYMKLDIYTDKDFSRSDELKSLLKNRTLELEKTFKELSPGEDLKQTLNCALRASRLSDGAFDITGAPLIKAWGFADKNYRIPSDEELEELCLRVDYNQLIVNKNGSFSLPEGMEIDLGGCAKGYLGDALRSIIEAYGIKSAMLNLGGNMVLIGSKPDGSDFNIGIADPYNPDSVIGYVSVSDTNVITSGGYLRYFTGEDGETYWHILDPENGKPARSGLTSVTVIGKDGCLCDCLSTALFVMGREKALAFYETYKDELGVELILVNDDGSVECTSKISSCFTACK